MQRSWDRKEIRFWSERKVKTIALLKILPFIQWCLGPGGGGGSGEILRDFHSVSEVTLLGHGGEFDIKAESSISGL